MLFRSLGMLMLVVFGLGTATTFAGKAKPPKTPKPQGSKPTPQWIMNNGSQGREFVFCLPLNDCPTCPPTAREIYVTSSKNTAFDYEVPALGFKSRLQVKAGKVTVINGAGGVFPMPEIEPSETASDLCMSIKADDNVSVYVYNGKNVSSDGYLAIPVASWGKEYYALSYPDFREFDDWKGGFCFMASEDNTLVDVFLRSRTYGEYAVSGLNTRTEGGHRYGDHFQVNLMRGQAYIVQGDGTTRGQFDLSGSRVVASKPIGFIDFHQRTMIPCFALGGGRDHICEMVPPTEQWGRTYVSVEFLRKGYGDLYRAVAKEDGTNITWECYDFKSGKRLNGPTGVLNMKAGEVRSLPKSPEEVSQGPGSTTAQSKGIQGMAIFRGNKPFQLMHECCSAEWDGDGDYDPYIIYSVPQEQYTKGTIFQCPTNPRYSTHYFAIIAVGDSADPSAKLLKSIKIDGKYIYNTTPSFLGNRIPGTNLYWARMGMASGAHVIMGDTPFGGEIYGYGQFDSYGWPAATAFRQLNQFDTLPPVLTKVEECGDFTYLSTEIRNFKVNDTLNHTETGVREIDFVDTADAKSYNYRIVLLTSEGKDIQDNRVPTDRNNFKMTFRLEVIDKTKSAFAKFYVMDRALNITYDSVQWIAPDIRTIPDPIDFGRVRVGTSKTMDVWVKNFDNVDHRIKSVKMKLGTFYSCKADSTSDTLGLLLKAKDSILVKITYSPTEEVTDLVSDFDPDSLLVEETCPAFAFYVRGQGVLPHIKVGDYNAGTIGVGQSACNGSVSNNLLIQNTGTDTLHVSGIDESKIIPPFSIKKPTTPPFTFAIPPGGKVVFKEICFSPTMENQFSIDVPFLSDAPTSPKDDPISTWTGASTSPGPYVIGNDWDSVRLGVSKMLPCYVKNSGTLQATCSAIDTIGGVYNEYAVTKTERDLPFIVYPNNLDMVRVDVTFTPTVEGKKSLKLEGLFDGTLKKDGALLGYGYLEKIRCDSAEFTEPKLVGTSVSSSKTGEYVGIHNTSTSRWLTIYRVGFVNEPNNDATRMYPTDFAWAAPPPQNVTMNIGDPALQLPITFTPSKQGYEHVRVWIEHNAEPITANPTFHAFDTVLVTGQGVIQNQPYLKGYDFRTHTACDLPVGYVTIGNTALKGSLNSDRIVDSLWVDGADATNFSLVNAPTTSATLTIPPDTFAHVALNFIPSPLRKGAYIAYVHARFSDGTTLHDSVMAFALVSTVSAKTSFPNHSQDLTLDGSLTIMNVEANCATWTDAGLKSFTAVVRYHRNDLIFSKGSAQLGTMFDNTWKIDSAVQVNSTSPDSVDLVISASGNTALNASGVVLRTTMQMLIDSVQTRVFHASLVDFKPNGRENCVIIQLAHDSTTISGCYMGGRFIKVSETPFALQSVAPQPATNGYATIKYSVGFDAPTRIEVINDKGEIVSTLSDEMHKKGEYTFVLDLQNYASGVYHVRMTSAHLNYTRPMVVSK